MACMQINMYRDEMQIDRYVPDIHSDGRQMHVIACDADNICWSPYLCRPSWHSKRLFESIFTIVTIMLRINIKIYFPSHGPPLSCGVGNLDHAFSSTSPFHIPRLPAGVTTPDTKPMTNTTTVTRCERSLLILWRLYSVRVNNPSTTNWGGCSSGPETFLSDIVRWQTF